MRRKSLAVVIAFLLALTTDSLAAFSATPIKGAPCPAVGRTYVSNSAALVCARSGSTNTWKTAGTTSKDQASAPKKPDLAPWSTSITLSQIVDASQANLLTWINRQKNLKSNTSKILVYIDPKVPATLANRLSNVEKFAIPLFGADGPPTYYEFIAASRQWILNKTSELGVPISGIDLVCGPDDPENSIQGCSDGYSTTYIVIHSPDLVTNDAHGSAVGVHEYFHAVQGQLLFDKNSFNQIFTTETFLRWLKEGSADWLGLSLYHYYFNLNYKVLRSNYAQRGLPGTYTNPLSDYISFRAPNIQPYTIGRSAVELIVAFKGMDGLLNIMRNYRKSGDMQTAFSDALGISLSDFYQYFESVRAKLEVLGPTAHAVCGENVPLSQPARDCSTSTSGGVITGAQQGNSPEPVSQAATDLSAAAVGLSRSGHSGVTYTNASGQRLYCKVESDGNIHWVSS